MEDMKLVPVVLQLKEELPEIVDGKTTGNTVWVASNGRGYVNVEEMKQFDEVFIYTKDGQFTARKPSKHIQNIFHWEQDKKPELTIIPDEPPPAPKPAPRKSRRAAASKAKKGLN